MFICEACGCRMATQRHHKFHNTKVNRKYYGDLLDSPFNIQYTCADCNASHRGDNLIHWSEIRFCYELGIEPRSKTGKEIWKRLKEKNIFTYEELLIKSIVEEE